MLLGWIEDSKINQCGARGMVVHNAHSAHVCFFDVLFVLHYLYMLYM